MERLKRKNLDKADPSKLALHAKKQRGRVRPEELEVQEILSAEPSAIGQTPLIIEPVNQRPIEINPESLNGSEVTTPRILRPDEVVGVDLIRQPGQLTNEEMRQMAYPEGKAKA